MIHILAAMKHRRLNFTIFILFLLFVRTSFGQSENDPFFSSIAPKPDLQMLCMNFLDCESEMMNIHQKCTEKSRKATGEACGLMEDFKQLNMLMEARVTEFGACVGNETEMIENDPEKLDFLNLPYEKCQKVQIKEMEEIMVKDGCWKAVAMVKKRCHQLQKCCPASKICMKSGRNSDATKEVREKHIEINRKTLECRNAMKKILDEQKKDGITDLMKARAHAVLTSQGDTLMDAIQKKYVFNKKERHEMRNLRNELHSAISAAKPSPPMLPSTVKPVKHVILGEAGQTTSKKAVQKRIRKPKAKKFHTSSSPNNNPLILFNAPSLPGMRQNVGRLPPPPQWNAAKTQHRISNMKQQLEEFEEMLHKLEVKNETTTIATTATTATSMKPSFKIIFTRKPDMPRIMGKSSVTKTANVLNSFIHERNNGFIPKFKAMHQPQSFAIPSTVNLTKMHVMEARPELEIEMKKSTIKNVNILGKPKLPLHRPRIQSIQTQTDFEKPIMKSFKIDQDLAPINEAFVSSDGQWTLQPESTPPTTTTTFQHSSSTPEYSNEGSLGDDDGIGAQKSLGENKQKLFGDKQRPATPNEIPPELVVFGSKESFPTNTKKSTEIPPAMLRTTMKASDQSHLNILNPVIPPKIKMSRADEVEMLVVKEDLIRNLEEFVKKSKRKQKDKIKFSKEISRLELLRKGKEEYEAEQTSMDYCKLYTICSDEQKFVAKTCETSSGRLIPGLPRRRFGECNRKLVSQYKRMNSMKQKVEKLFDQCLSKKIAMNEEQDAVSESCPREWPMLPQFEEEVNCQNRIRMIQNHCAKLSRCCSAAQDCRLAVDEMPVSFKLIQKEEYVAQASAKCQIKAYNDYLKFKTKRFGDVKMEKSRKDLRMESSSNNNDQFYSSATQRDFTSPFPPSTAQTSRAIPDRVYPALIHVGNYQPQRRSIQINDGKLSNLKRIDTGHIKLLWE